MGHLDENPRVLQEILTELSSLPPANLALQSQIFESEEDDEIEVEEEEEANRSVP